MQTVAEQGKRSMMDDRDIIREFLIESSENLARLEAETILSQLRAGERKVSVHVISLILGVMDVTRTIMEEIELTSLEGSNRYPDLVDRSKACGFLGFGILEAITQRRRDSPRTGEVSGLPRPKGRLFLKLFSGGNRKGTGERPKLWSGVPLFGRSAIDSIRGLPGSSRHPEYR